MLSKQRRHAVVFICRGLALVALSLSAQGCVMGTQREGRVIAAASVARVKVGTTTRQEILDIFGPPTSFARAILGDSRITALRPPGGAAVPAPVPEDVYTYEYREENETFFTLALLYTSFRRLKLSDTLMIVFDPQDLVKHVAFSRQTEAEPEPPPEKK